MNSPSRTFLALCGLILALAAPALARAADEAGPLVGAPAPAFSLTAVDGRTLTLDSFKGKTLVVNVWGTWCPPCREETPDLIAAYKAVHAPDVEFLGVDTTEAAPIVRAFVASKGVPFLEAIDTNKTFAKAYDVRFFPTTLVIGPDGVLRARYVETITALQIRAFVGAARAGKNGVIGSPLQAKIDALLAPDRYAFSGAPEVVATTIKSATAAIDRADALEGDSDPAKGIVVDFIKVRVEQAALRDRVIAALQSTLATESDRATLAQLKGAAALESEHYTEALAGFDDALALDPNNEDALGGVAAAATALKHYDRAVAAERRLAQLAPSPDAYIELGNTYKAMGDFVRGGAAFERGIELAKAAIVAQPSPKTQRKLGAVYLYAGRLYSVAGEREKARAAFADLSALTLTLPKTDSRYAMYLEEAQEATVALDLGAAGANTTGVSLTPWTGPDLPGSIASTLKYRLVVTGAPAKSVTLTASGLPKAWIASFCTDKVCAPFRVVTDLPPSGVKVIEFQVVPDGPKAARAPRVRVDVRVGSQAASTSTLVGLR